MNDDRYGASKRLQDDLEAEWKAMKVILVVIVTVVVGLVGVMGYITWGIFK